MTLLCHIGVHHTTIWRLAQRFRTTGTVKDRPRSGGPKVSLLKKNVTSGSQQVVTASYQKQGLSIKYEEQLESVYPRKINLKLVISNQENRLKVWVNCPPQKTATRMSKSTHASKPEDSTFFRMDLDSHLSLQLIACVSGDGLVNVLQRLVLYQLTALMAVSWWCGLWGGVHYAGNTNLIGIRQTLNTQRYCDDIWGHFYDWINP
jgi:hypothetical protein